MELKIDTDLLWRREKKKKVLTSQITSYIWNIPSTLLTSSLSVPVVVVSSPLDGGV